MDFVTFDFETATRDRHSPCEIGLTVVEDSQIKEVKSWLIKPFSYPYFDPFNVAIHGITASQVSSAPTFDEFWDSLKPLIEGKFLIAHNASFDISVLRKTLDHYDLAYPNFKYSCSRIFSKQVWEGLPDYGLKTLCNVNDIQFTHHRAGADSEATAKLVLKAFEKVGLQSLDEFPDKLKTTIGEVFEDGYNPAKKKRQYAPEDTVVGDPSKHDEENVFYGKTVVFTGSLMSMPRKDAQQKVADIGGVLGKGVTKSTDYLVVGQQDYRVVGDEGMSRKQAKAIDMIEKGASLEILSEQDFLMSI